MRTIIAAVSANGYIGRDGKIPWRLKSDIVHFKETTTGNTVVMGRKTWESLLIHSNPLPNRRNIVLTRLHGYAAEGAEVAHSIEDVLVMTEEDEYEHGKHVFFMGGSEVYQFAFPYAERLLITRVHGAVSNGDVMFPEPIPGSWNLVSRTELFHNEGDEYSFHIEDYSPNLPFIEMATIRTSDQLRTMRKIREANHCPFCRENLYLYHNRPVTWEGDFWLLTDNQWPYPGRNVHKLVILKRHVVNIEGLPQGAMEELSQIAKMVKEETGVVGGAIAMREGDPILSGASVRHLHAQIISPKRGSPEPVRIFVGTSTR